MSPECKAVCRVVQAWQLVTHNTNQKLCAMRAGHRLRTADDTEANAYDATPPWGTQRQLEESLWLQVVSHARWSLCAAHWAALGNPEEAPGSKPDFLTGCFAHLAVP